jgi:phage baseplate assembly protein gpV
LSVGVTRVEFYVNGALKCAPSAAPYSCAWEVPGGAGKSYKLEAWAYDAAGNVGKSALVTATSN